MTSLSHLIINFITVINSQLIPPPILIVPPLQPQRQEHIAIKQLQEQQLKYKTTIVAYGQATLASWYGPGFNGNLTASGEIFNQYAMTVAHPYFDFGTELEITYNGRSVIARVNDRGPYTGGREIDLSLGVAEVLGFDGVDYVQVRVLN